MPRTKGYDGEKRAGPLHITDISDHRDDWLVKAMRKKRKKYNLSERVVDHGFWVDFADELSQDCAIVL